MAAMSFHLEKSNYAQIIPMDMRHILPKFYESRFNPRKVMRILRIGKFWRKIIIINIAVGDSDAGLRVPGASA